MREVKSSSSVLRHQREKGHQNASQARPDCPRPAEPAPVVRALRVRRQRGLSAHWRADTRLPKTLWKWGITRLRHRRVQAHKALPISRGITSQRVPEEECSHETECFCELWAWLCLADASISRRNLDAGAGRGGVWPCLPVSWLKLAWLSYGTSRWRIVLMFGISMNLSPIIFLRIAPFNIERIQASGHGASCNHHHRNHRCP